MAYKRGVKPMTEIDKCPECGHPDHPYECAKYRELAENVTEYHKAHCWKFTEERVWEGCEYGMDNCPMRPPGNLNHLKADSFDEVLEAHLPNKLARLLDDDTWYKQMDKLGETLLSEHDRLVNKRVDLTVIWLGNQLLYDDGPITEAGVFRALQGARFVYGSATSSADQIPNIQPPRTTSES
jgi:hypothetical protein